MMCQNDQIDDCSQETDSDCELYRKSLLSRALITPGGHIFKLHLLKGLIG